MDDAPTPAKGYHVNHKILVIEQTNFMPDRDVTPRPDLDNIPAQRIPSDPTSTNHKLTPIPNQPILYHPKSPSLKT